jgi:dolichyl-phosphate beta-glucosyltransferase
VSDGPRLSLVVPAYNESARLVDTLDRCVAWLNASMPSWELVVVDDGSVDDTRALALRAAAAEPRIRVVSDGHRGKGGAVRLGMLAARGDWRFFADADLSMDLDQLPRFLATGADVAIASREAPGAERIGEPVSRHLIGRVFNALVRLLVVPGLSDTQCGYKLFSANAAQQLFSMARLDGFAFDVELLYLARRAGFQVREVPITWHHRRGSRVGVATGVVAFAQLLLIRWNALLGRYDSGLRRLRQPT